MNKMEYKNFTKNIIKELNNIKDLSCSILNLNDFDRTKLTLGIIKTIAKNSKNEEEVKLSNDLSLFLEKYKMQNTSDNLIDIANKEIKNFNFEYNEFKCDRYIFDTLYYVINSELEKICGEIPYRTDLLLLYNFKKLLKNIFVDNVNFKKIDGEVSFYEKHMDSYDRYKQISISHIKDEVKTLIDFYNDFDENEEISDNEILDMSLSLEEKLKRKITK